MIRAAGFKNGFAPSGVDTHSYIVTDDALSQSASPAGWPDRWNDIPADYAMDSSMVSSARADLTAALAALPTVSVVTPKTNLFDPATGIYVNPYGTGDEWERAASAEWIDPGNGSRFQIDCGLRIQGGAFRGMELTLKKSFTLRFRSRYGESDLTEDLFGTGAVSTFNSLVLRGGANDAWDFWGHENTQYIVDEFVRRSHLAMGGVSPHGRFVHLYLNGLYWGLYNVTEHISSDFAAAYCGGQKGSWDVRSQDGPLDGDGDDTAWNAMLDVLRAKRGSNATYQRVQGNNPDGARNPAYPVYLDVDNYIDYMIVQYWSANADWPGNNYRAFRNRNDALGTGFKFSVWDAEAGVGVWGGLGTDQTGSSDGVAVIQRLLSGNAEYRLRFADRVQKHLFNGGPLTTACTIPRYQALAAEIEPALVAESARWGDQDGDAAHTVAQWRAQRDTVLKTFLTQRNGELLRQFRSRGLFPAVKAPVFSRSGGLFTNSLGLVMTAAHPIYYTLDGRDPRQYGTGEPVGILYTNGAAISRTARVRARARSSAGVWSAATEALFTLAEMPALRVSELMYHPRRPASVAGESYAEGDDEFIELRNAGSSPIGLAGLRFTEGVLFDFTDGAVPVLKPGGHVLVVKNIAAFTNRYPTVPLKRIAGAFAFPSTGLDNAGETIRIEDAAGRTVLRFSFSNRWRVATDGAGHSLVPVWEGSQADGELDYAGNWKASAFIGGSPGQAEPAAPASALVLNEILAHTDVNSPPYDSNDGIELYNGSAAPLTVGAGWYLSDDPGNLAKWAIPATSTIPARGWRYFDEMHDFHNPITNGFGLDKAGEQVLLSYLPGTAGADRVVDAVSFGAQKNNEPWARFPDGADSWLAGESTPGDSNRLAGAGVVIDEVMYHPLPPAGDPEGGEYVELFNPTPVPIGLANAPGDGGGGWRLAGGLGFVFPTNTVLPAGGRLVVVPFDPATNAAARAAFLSAYNLTNGQIQMRGPCSGHLDNRTDSVRLEQPLNPAAGDAGVLWHAIDQVAYFEAPPWPVAAAGSGRSLQRKRGRTSGALASSWTAGLLPTPGEGPAIIRISAPFSGMAYLAPFSAPVQAEVDGDAVAGAVERVELHDGADLVATDLTAPYGFTLDGLTNAGGHVLTAHLVDEAGSHASPPVPITVYTNAPTAEAGADRRINLAYNGSLSLSATLAAHGFPTQRVTYAWSLVSGPGFVVFSDPSSLRTMATFSTAGGPYVLQLTTIFDDMISTADDVAVTVVSTNTPNDIPFRESFERYQAGEDLAGVDGWSADSAGIAMVAASGYADGYSGTYPIPGPHRLLLRGTGGAFSNLFQNTLAKPDVWVDAIIQGPNYKVPAIPPPHADAQVAFAVNGSGQLVVWNRQPAPGSTNGWTALPDTSLAPDVFVRLTAQISYTNRDESGFPRFRLWVGEAPVTNPAVWFSAANKERPYMSQLAIKGPVSVDDVMVVDRDPMTGIPAGALRAGQEIKAASGAQPAAAAALNGWLARRDSPIEPDSTLNRDDDSDGAVAWKEYVAGTDPADESSVFALQLCVSNGHLVVVCPTIPAGAEYGGLARYYTLESATDLQAGAWTGIKGWTNLLGSGQPLVFTNPPSPGSFFFRAKVMLK